MELRNTFKQAINFPQSKEWTLAMGTEIDIMKIRNVWHLLKVKTLIYIILYKLIKIDSIAVSKWTLNHYLYIFSDFIKFSSFSLLEKLGTESRKRQVNFSSMNIPQHPLWNIFQLQHMLTQHKGLKNRLSYF